jgi:hypothetical protein
MEGKRRRGRRGGGPGACREEGFFLNLFSLAGDVSYRYDTISII